MKDHTVLVQLIVTIFLNIIRLAFLFVFLCDLLIVYKKNHRVPYILL